MKEHYETKATDAQKRAKLASVNGRWNKEVPRGRESMTFNYHEGSTTDSPIIYPEAEIYRDKPVPKVRICHSQDQARYLCSCTKRRISKIR